MMKTNKNILNATTFLKQRILFHLITNTLDIDDIEKEVNYNCHNKDRPIQFKIEDIQDTINDMLKDKNKWYMKGFKYEKN